MKRLVLFMVGVLMTAIIQPISAVAAAATPSISTQSSLPSGASLPDGFKLIEGQNNSWKIVPTATADSSSVATLEDAYLTSASAIGATPNRLVDYLNSFGMTVFSNSTLRGQGTYTGSLATGADLEIDAGSGLNLTNVAGHDYSAILNGDLIFAAGESFSLATTAPILFSGDHGFTGSGNVPWGLINWLKANADQVKAVPNFDQDYFTKLKTAVNTLATFYASQAQTATPTNPSYNQYTFTLDQAHYDTATNTYYFTMDGTSIKPNAVYDFAPAAGETIPADAKVVVNVTNDAHVTFEGATFNVDSVLNPNQILFNLPTASTVDTVNAGRNFNGIRILAPNALVQEQDATFTGTANIFGGESTNPFVPLPVVQGTVTIHYVDEAGTPIVAPTTLTRTIGDPYTTEAKNFPGYTLTATPANATGRFNTAPQSVTYIYRQAPSP
ncbi:MucBP domain-containing protein [Lacticaseibacillus yichunensis]|uniref:MucBP domain-containing protein n=1 Tax=Lacticaseibacillus yichunensis TaxID=2486015 RepID=A0ABW4CP73_9LACO|nr:MucBP domain-containing protein [Lacticaseibacillus yichunensis]